MNKTYIRFYQQKIFTIKDARKIIKDKQVCLNNLSRLVDKGLIKRIKNGIYYIIPLDNKEFYPNPIHISSLIRPDSIICCNTALTAYGLYNDTKTHYIYSKHPAMLRIAEHTYKILKNKQTFGIIKLEFKTGYGSFGINTTNIERTLIDCVRTRSIRLDELIKIFRNPKITIDIGDIISYLDKYKKPILYNKVGLVLDNCKSYLKIEDEDLDKIRKKLTKRTFYARERGLTLLRPKFKYYGRWNLMIPEGLHEMIVPKTNI